MARSIDRRPVGRLGFDQGRPRRLRDGLSPRDPNPPETLAWKRKKPPDIVHVPSTTARPVRAIAGPSPASGPRVVAQWMKAALGERSSEDIRMTDRAASQQTLEEFFEMLLDPPRRAPAPEAAPTKAFTFDDLLRALGLEVKAPTPAERPSPSQTLDEVFGVRAKPAATPQPEPQPTVPVAAMPSLEAPIQDADWTPSTAGTMPAYTVYVPATSPQFEPRQVVVPTPPPAPPAGWSPWKIAVAALGVLGMAGLGYLGARRFQQLERTVHVLLAEFQGDVDGKLRTLHGRVAAIERTAAVDRTQAIREVRRALQAESDELRGHREWLASIRANAPANATHEAEEQLMRADREIDDLFARIDKTDKS